MVEFITSHQWLSTLQCTWTLLTVVWKYSLCCVFSINHACKIVISVRIYIIHKIIEELRWFSIPFQTFLVWFRGMKIDMDFTTLEDFGASYVLIADKHIHTRHKHLWMLCFRIHTVWLTIINFSWNYYGFWSLNNSKRRKLVSNSSVTKK